MKSAISGIMLTLLLTNMVTLAFNIQPVKAGGTIYIKSDGSIDPSTAPIQRYENLYVFTDNIYNHSIIVQKDHITLDGNGYLLEWLGSYSDGINLYARKNVTITNMVISGFLNGIRLDSSTDNKITNNTIFGSDCGILLFESSQNNILENNTLTDNNSAILVMRSRRNTLIGNKVSNNVYGISLYTSTQNTLRENIMNANKYNFYVGLFFEEYYIHDIDTSNIVDGKPIYYWINRYNETVPMDAGCIVVVNSSNITVKNLEIKNNFPGVALAYTVNSLIENVSVKECGDGISLDHCKFCLVKGNKICCSFGAGIGLTESTHNEVAYNVVLNATGAGIWLEDTNLNTVICNEIVYTHGGAGFQEFDGAGILVDDSPFCKIVSNNSTMNHYGIVVGAMFSRDNIIIQNNMVMNDVGLILYEGQNNTVYYNNFVDNKMSQVCTYHGTKNILDSGYPFGGNYWSDYTGVDLYSGPFQNETGGDGVGDTPYIVDENNIDKYPLMNLWGSGIPLSSFSWSPMFPEVDELVTFDASASMPVGGKILSYEWDFGDGVKASGKIVTHVYNSAGNYTITLNVTDNEGLWDIEQKQIEVMTPPQLTVSITPTLACILVGQATTFNSTVSGGYPPYNCQWYLNGAPISGVTSNTWTFMPRTSGIFYIYLKVTDSKGNTAHSETANITVATVPIGGCSVSPNKHMLLRPITMHITLTVILTAIFITIKRRTKRKHT